MALNSIKTYLSQEKKAIGVGTGCYILSLLIILLCVILLVKMYSIAFTGLFLIDVLLIEVILSLPAIPSSLVASYISKKRKTGIYTVGISGFLVISLLSLIILIILLFTFLQSPPTDHYEEFSRGMLLFFFTLLYPFFFFPISALSAIFALIVERSYFYFYSTRNS